MTNLNSQQIQQAIQILHSYLSAQDSEGRTVVEIEAEINKNRITVINGELTPLLHDFFGDKMPTSDFKTKIDGINKRNRLWGFNGTKGQMFFNLLLNVAEDESESDKRIKEVIRVPLNDVAAENSIRSFSEYVKGIAEQHVLSGGSKHAKPNVSSVPFFLSYFWQIQDRDVWPIYYTNSVNVMNDLNLWQPMGDSARDYSSYKSIHEELVEAFTAEVGRQISLYDVEHVFWFRAGNPPGAANVEKPKPPLVKPIITYAGSDKPSFERLPDSYVPPIVAALPEIARSEPALREAAKASGTSLERAFEKSIDAAFGILGYETQLLGQGKGRVPDGLALNRDDSYAILWDAKIRSDPYAMGTDDRTIKEYIVTQSRELKRRRGLRNIYYFVVSSRFQDDYDDAIRALKMETDVNEVCLVEADALVAMVDLKMRHPQEVSLGPDGLQRLMSVSGVLTAELVRESFA